MDDLNFEEVDSLIPAAVGEPGSRVFYIQARHRDHVVALKLEKEQVGMLGGYLGSVLGNLGAPEPDRDIAGLIEPVVPAWIVGSISVGIDEDARSIMVTLEELVFDEDGADTEDLEGRSARFVLRAAQAAAFAEATAELMAAGRAQCRLCGAPMDPSGHACPRWN